jgi:RimJ/RimL family protein N-acetyltransferase
MISAPTLSDGHVTLRAHRREDARGSFEQCQDPLSIAWTTVPVPYSMEQAHGYVTEVLPKGWAEDTEWSFAIEVEGEYGGTVSLRNEGDGRAEIAYGSHPRVRGTGAVEAALRLLLEWGFTERGLHTVIWRANKGNWASRKVAWRLGFSFDGTVRSWLPQRGKLRDAWVGTLLRDDPREPRSPWLEAPVLEGERVRLRPWLPTDAPRIVEACDDERTAHWLGRMPSPYTLADAEAYLEDRIEVLASGRAVGWAVADPESDDVIGSLALFDLTPGRQAEIGYWTHPDARGRGAMTEAVGLAVRHGFGELALVRLVAFAATENSASRRVIEANGFRLVGIERQSVLIRTGLADHAAYELLAGDLSR